MTTRTLLPTLFACCLLLACGNAPRQLRFTHFSIDSHLPPLDEEGGYGTASIGLADYDKDGDLDIALSRRQTLTAYWYERRDDSTWVQHAIGTSEKIGRALGADAMDVDRDGLTDYVINKVWFRNPGNLGSSPDAPWPMQDFDSGDRHDIVPGDIDGDGYDDIITYGYYEAEFDSLAWFNTARGLERTVISAGFGHHGGLAPGGAGDLDGDGDIDLVVPEFWFANPGIGTGEWVRHEYPYTPIPNATYGKSTRSWVADLDSDGHNDIVYADCDTRDSHVYWCRNTGGGLGWELTRLPDPPTAQGDVPGTGSWHSLGVADFDLDGDLDIFAGEQEDSTMNGQEPRLSMKAVGLKERGVIWLNDGAARPAFSTYVIHVDNPGWHDARLGDVDGDGDIDIVSKVWNKDGEFYHADYWRNEIR